VRDDAGGLPKAASFVTLGRNVGANVQDVQVAIDPMGPDSASGGNHWAAVVFGTTPGDDITGTGTGVLVCDTGTYELWDRGALKNIGNVGAKTDPSQFYSIDFAIDPSTGAYTLSIDGQQLFTGIHGPYTTNYVTLEDYTFATESGTWVDYFANLSISGTTSSAAITAAPNTTYYVSSGGDDGNAGTSPAAAWRSLAHVHQVDFRPGDQVLFQGGATFSGNLWFDSQDVGTASAPISVGSYGSGEATINAGSGIGVSVVDDSNIQITNLWVIGSGYTSNQSDGMLFTSDIPGATITANSVGDVDVSGFGRAAIRFLGSSGSLDFCGISVTYSALHDNGCGGLAVDGQGAARNVYVGHVDAYHNAGDLDSPESGFGIFVGSASHVVIERSVANDNGWLDGNAGETGGIEAVYSSYVLLQYNEAYANYAGAGDGHGIILDATTNSIMQFNYTHGNDGAGFFLGAEPYQLANNNIVRYNVSENDARRSWGVYGGAFVWGDVENAQIYNNTVFMSPTPTYTPAAIKIIGWCGSELYVRNNIFITTGGVPVVYWDNSGGDYDPVLQGNDYWSSGDAFDIVWAGTDYAGLDGANGWLAMTGEEMVDGTALGWEVDPQLNAPGDGGTIGNADNLDQLTAYELQSTSPVRRTGLDLSQFFDIVWDPYAYGSDSFLGTCFPARAQDLYGHPLPAAGSSLFSIGADQFPTAEDFLCDPLSVAGPSLFRTGAIHLM
jgi:hypothetical protein